MAFKEKYGHCDVPFTGENASLGRWCNEMRVSYKKIQNNQMPASCAGCAGCAVLYIHNVPLCVAASANMY